jgi:hypothetical protein
MLEILLDELDVISINELDLLIFAFDKKKLNSVKFLIEHIIIEMQDIY